MIYTALVPVKSLTEAKSRLAMHLSPARRRALMLKMLRHVLETLHDSQIFTRVSVVSPDPAVLEIVQTWGAHAYKEEAAGHNPALTAAATRELRAGSNALLTISADLPLLRVEDVYRLLEQAKNHAVVLAPSQDQTGTNALVASPPLVLPYLFGINSFLHYQEEIRRRQLRSTAYSSIGLALDIDTMEDLEHAHSYELAGTQPWRMR